jgi:recombination protein RecT
MTRAEQLRNALPDAPTSGAPVGNAVATRKPDPARDLIQAMQSEFEAALPKSLPIDLFMRVTLTGFRKNPNLLNCSRKSLLGALLETARLGLEPCTEQAYLIPYKTECTLVIGYQGYVQLMYRTGQVESVEAELVYENDEWEYSLGDGGKFFHRPNLLADDRGKALFAYSFAKLVGGGRTKVAITTRRDAEQIMRDNAKSSSSPWKTGSFDAMWLKTPVRQLQKWAPKSAEMRRAAALDGATYSAELGEPDVDPNVLEGEVVPDPISASPSTDGQTTDGPA